MKPTILKSLYTAAAICITSQAFCATQPNVLFIAIDDLKPTIGAYGNEVPTPSIDRISDAGTTFLNAHCQQAVCGPSRASLMTGKYPDYTQIWDLQTLIRDIHPDIVTIPQYFKAQGYQSVGVGKIYDPRSVDKGSDTASWSQPYAHTWHLDYNAQTGKPTGHYHNAKTKALAAEAEAQGKTGWNAINKYLFKKDAWPVVECEDLPDNAYDDGAIADYAVNELAKLAKKDTPFFLAVGFKKPHLPFVAPKKYWDLFDRDSIELAPFQEHAEGSPDYAWHDSNELRSYNGVPTKGDLDEPTQRKLIHGYYASVAYIDAQVGKVLDQLDALGLDENTIIVFWGDHGWHLGDHGIWCKHTNYEQATRVPLIITMPGASQQITTMPAELVDLFPTLCDLAGLPKPENLDGISLAPTITDQDQKVRSIALSQFPRGSKMGYALRSERFRFVAWYETGKNSGAQKGDTITATELYDYQVDPLETRNLVNDPQYAKVVAAMQQALRQRVER
ncbi:MULTISPECIES: sulfatase [unclassified Lentimonas]|uniref:sulfatase n=1 Tax=unclassified Lentimonas TaxID=2630993 RepID=UPI001329F7BE|nr:MULTISPECIES: sulfatase [unclassified Lentimonas]CAA6678858.1 Choline-sulfatase (EC [Lentimonas sp. CC4]CAA6684462.1 Choline-sulfatase (EC [Lentimonas sp. CC6]CAA7077458.1 Choline-sulfatase (EC [Lentimonas sp. CC4]CAA7171293.1 Choline-sulfatase (EC [Lentimonas sp. CC21]CAA7183323.1 Choline-sulfatase (EC [Lentimonas sp. CC8]